MVKTIFIGSNLNREDECKLCYFAGLFDGEGSLGITRQTCGKIRRKDGKQTTRYIAKIQMQMIDREPIEGFAQFFGISVYKWNKQPNFNGELTTVYKIIVGSKQSKYLILSLLPYLKSPQKKIGADLCLRLLQSTERRKGMERPVSASVMKYREGLWKDSLNNNSQRGIKLHER